MNNWNLKWKEKQNKAEYLTEKEITENFPKLIRTLVCVAQLVEYQPMHQKVTGSISGQGTCSSRSTQEAAN